MMNYLREFGITFAIFFVIDMLWIGIVAKDLYKKHLGYLLSQTPNWLAAIAFYLLFIVGIIFFVINPAIEKRSWQYALFVGIFFGFITYATYDLTNLATIKDWPLTITVIDLIWGSILSGSVSLIAYSILTKMKWF